jgi:hypothetical protein
MTETRNKISACILVALLLFPTTIFGQQAPPPPVFVPGATPQVQNAGTRPGMPTGIKMVVLEGRGVNRLTEGVFAMPVVEVRDLNDRPIEGATVTFLLNGGPNAGAMFRDGSLEKTFTTTAQGQAAAEGYVPNNIVGKFTIRVRAAYQEATTEIRVEQENSFQLQADYDRKKARAWRKWLYIGGAAAGGIIAAVILTRNGSSSAPPTVIVNPGPPVFGGR